MSKQDICINRLIYDDYNDYLKLLEQLTEVNKQDITYDMFCNQLDNINSDIFVLRDNGKIIGAGSVLIEKKFIHSMSSVGHIEDIVVDRKYRGKGLGKTIINHLIQYCKDNKCYKVILDCSFENIEFYKKCGFGQKECHMVKYF